MAPAAVSTNCLSAGLHMLPTVAVIREGYLQHWDVVDQLRSTRCSLSATACVAPTTLQS